MNAIRYTVIVLIVVVNLSSNVTQEPQLFFKQAGEGETILFVHGSQEDYRTFLPQLHSLEEKFHLVTYSRRYNYPNDIEYHQGIEFNPYTEARDLETLRNSLGIDKFHIVGHSYGGLIAFAFAEKYPDHVHSLTVSEPPAFRIEGCKESLKITEKELIQKLKLPFEHKDTVAVMKVIFEFFAGQDLSDKLPEESMEALIANLSEMKALAYSEDPFLPVQFKHNIPTMIITSEHTMPIFECVNKALIRYNPEATVVNIYGASHDMWMNHSAVLSKHLKEFIKNQ